MGARFAWRRGGVRDRWSRAFLLTVIFAALSNAVALLVRQQEALIGISQFTALPLTFLSSAVMDPPWRRRGSQTSRATTRSTGRWSRPARRCSASPDWSAVWPRLGALLVLARGDGGRRPRGRSARTSGRLSRPGSDRRSAIAGGGLNCMGRMVRMPFHRYVALGDSFTEGVGDHDPTLPNGVRGWADRVAEGLAAGAPDFGYANLAIRGRKMDAILAEQVEPALALRPDLVSLYAGGNDILRPKVSIDALVQRYDEASAGWPRPGRTSCCSPASTSASRRCSGTCADASRPTTSWCARWPRRTGRPSWTSGGCGSTATRGCGTWTGCTCRSAGHQRMAIAVLDALGVEHDLVPSTSRRCRRWTAGSAGTPTWPGPGRTPRRGCSAGCGGRRRVTPSPRDGPSSRPSRRRAWGESTARGRRPYGQR